MISVQLEDYEQFRNKLLKYAEGLLRGRGFKNHKQNELSEVAKDIVQDVYIIFDKYHKNPFVTVNQLESFLKTCLYNRYRDEIDVRRGNIKYLVTGKGEFNDLNIFKNYSNEFSIEELDSLEQFKKCLKPRQIEILDSLLLGHNMEYIAKERGSSAQGINSAVKVIRDKYQKFVKYRQ